jgi:hypothetical protein
MRSARPAVKYPVVNQLNADGTRSARAAVKTVHTGNNIENRELKELKDFMNSDCSSSSSLEPAPSAGSMSPAETVNIANAGRGSVPLAILAINTTPAMANVQTRSGAVSVTPSSLGSGEITCTVGDTGTATPLLKYPGAGGNAAV